MNLTLPERIQILRKRAGLNQTQLGVKAFGASPGYGRTKIKNIELGKQQPTQEDIRRIADCFEMTPAKLMGASAEGHSGQSQTAPPRFDHLNRRFPDLGDYLHLLDKAIAVDDPDLVEYLRGRIAAILDQNPQQASDPDVAREAPAG